MDIEFARQQMVEQQVRGWDVIDSAVLDVMAHIPRETFIPAAWRHCAFADVELPIGEGQYSFSPKLEGRLLQALDLQPNETVLEIGTGCGYFTACLARLAGQVTTMERISALAESAGRRLRNVATDNIEAIAADASDGLPEQRFNVVVVGGSIAGSLKPFEASVKPGGRLLAVHGSGPIMTVKRCTRVGENRWLRDSLFETVLPPLAGFGPHPQFQF